MIGETCRRAIKDIAGNCEASCKKYCEMNCLEVMSVLKIVEYASCGIAT